MARKILYEYETDGMTLIRVVQGDLTQEPVDAIVNAANCQLSHGGGVAGAIARAGGPDIQHESDRWVEEHGPVPTGDAAITGGGRMRCDYVVHAVGPIYDAVSRPAELLGSAVRASLQLADDHGLESIALPAISTGIFGYPMEEAAQVMLRAAIAYLKGETGLERVVFCLYDQSAFDIFAEELSAQSAEA